MESLFNSFSSFSYLSLTVALKSIFVGTTLSIIIFGVKRFFKNKFAEMRYVTLWCILALIIVLPVLSVTVSYNLFENSFNSLAKTGEVSPRQPSVLENNSNRVAGTTAKSQLISYIPNSQVKTAPQITEEKQIQTSYWNITLRFIPVLLSVAWLILTLVLLYRVFKSYDTVLRLKHSARLIDGMGYRFVENALASIQLNRPVRVGTSDDISIPIAAGFKYPMILLPKNIIHELSEKELEIIVMHELTHLKRYDDFSKLGQRIIEAFGFFNPAVKWIGHQLDLEREVACDSFVIDRIGSTNTYAECLTRLMRITHGTGTTLIPGFYSSKKQIFKRFEEMFMHDKKKRKGFSKYILASVLTMVLLFTFTLVQVTPVIAIPGNHLTFEEINTLLQTSDTKNIDDEKDLEKNSGTDIDWEHDYSPTINPDVDYTFDFDPKKDLDSRVLVIDGTLKTSDDILDNITQRKSRGVFSRLARKTDDLFNNIRGTAISHDDGETTIFWSDGRDEFRVSYFGEIEFTDDDKWIKSISKDGYLSIYEERGRTDTEFYLQLDKNGEFDIEYLVDGDEKEFDEDGKEWVAEILESMFLKTGLNAEKRVARMYAEGGSDKVLDYLDKVESDYVYRIYITELLLQDELSEKDYSRILTLVEENIDSDYEKAELLIEISPTINKNDNLLDEYVFAVKSLDSDYETRRVLSSIVFDDESDPKIISTVLEIAEDIDSDYEKAELLMDMSKICRSNPELNEKYVQAMKTIDSDYETRRVFSALGKKSEMTDKTLQELLLLAEDLDSDYEKAEYLIDLSDLVDDELGMLMQIIKMSATIDSDYETRRVLDSYRYDCDKYPELLEAKLLVLDKMDSDYERVESLLEHSDCAAENDKIREVYLHSLENVHSDYEKKRGLQDLINHSDLTGNIDFIKTIINFTGTIDSDYEKSEILSEIAEDCRDNKELEDLYLEAVNDMSSDYEIEKLYNLIDKKYKTSRRTRSVKYD